MRRNRLDFAARCSLLAATVGCLVDPAEAQTPNALILVADCISPWDLDVYNPPPGDAAETFALKELELKGIRFETAWGYSTCSPTRSCIQTGRLGFRTGIGKEIDEVNNGVGLPGTELILPRMLDDYAAAVWDHAAFGKWHLSEVEYVQTPPTKPDNAPDVLGYSLYRGQMFALKTNELYCKPAGAPWTPWDFWESSPGIDPLRQMAADTDILVTRHTQDAIDWIATAGSPWLCYVAFQAPYELHRAPETGTYTTPIGNFPQCTKCNGSNQAKRACFKAYMESLDHQIDRLLDAVTAQYGTDWSNTTTVFFLADNGTPAFVTNPGVPPDYHKATQTEGGLAIPFLVSGASIPTSSRDAVSPALAHAVDLFATIASIAGIDLGTVTPTPPPLDSFDLTPIFSDPQLSNPNTPRRAYLYSEIFPENVDVANLPVLYGSSNLRIARDARYKYVFRPTSGPNVEPFIYTMSGHRAGDEFYDLEFGEEVSTDNLNGPNPIDEGAHEGGNAARVALLQAIRDLLGIQ